MTKMLNQMSLNDDEIKAFLPLEKKLELANKAHATHAVVSEDGEISTFKAPAGSHRSQAARGKCVDIRKSGKRASVVAL